MSVECENPRTLDIMHEVVLAVDTTTRQARVYVDRRFGLSFRYPASWTVMRGAKMYLRPLQRINPLGSGVIAPDHNAAILVVAGRGSYTRAQLQALERDALTQALRQATPIRYGHVTYGGVTYQTAWMYGGYFDTSSHIAINDQLVLAAVHGPYTYVVSVGVKQGVPSTRREEAQAGAIITSLTIR